MTPYKRAALSLLLLFALNVDAQETKPDITRTDPAQAAMAQFYDCAKSYSEKYSKSREPAQDIADAALSYCEAPRERLRSLLIEKLSLGGRSARDQVNSLFPGIIEKARLLSIRTIVESRYEATLRSSAGAAPPAISAAPAFRAESSASSVLRPDPTPTPPFEASPQAQRLTTKPDEAVPMPYIDAAQPMTAAPGGARPDPGALPPDLMR